MTEFRLHSTVSGFGFRYFFRCVSLNWSISWSESCWFKPPDLQSRYQSGLEHEWLNPTVHCHQCLVVCDCCTLWLTLHQLVPHDAKQTRMGTGAWGSNRLLHVEIPDTFWRLISSLRYVIESECCWTTSLALGPMFCAFGNSLLTDMTAVTPPYHDARLPLLITDFWFKPFLFCVPSFVGSQATTPTVQEHRKHRKASLNTSSRF